MPAAANATLLSAKVRCRRAHRLVREADERMSATWDRAYAETLLAIDDQPAEQAAVMLTRVAILFEVAVDRMGWVPSGPPPGRRSDKSSDQCPRGA